MPFAEPRPTPAHRVRNWSRKTVPPTDSADTVDFLVAELKNLEKRTLQLQVELSALTTVAEYFANRESK